MTAMILPTRRVLVKYLVDTRPVILIFYFLWTVDETPELPHQREVTRYV